MAEELEAEHTGGRGSVECRVKLDDRGGVEDNEIRQTRQVSYALNSNDRKANSTYPSLGSIAERTMALVG